MKVDNSFATPHSNKYQHSGWYLFIHSQSHTYMHHQLHFFQARTCQLMLLNSIYCIKYSCPSAHVRF